MLHASRSSHRALRPILMLLGAALSGLPAAHGGANGTVRFQDGTPIAGAHVFAYRITGAGAARRIELVGDAVVSGVDGHFAQPAAFDDEDYEGVRLGLRALVTYMDPGNGVGYTVANYPNHDPYLLDAPHGLAGTEEIIFPQPVVMQGGYNGGHTTWDNFRAYLVADPAGQVDQPWPERKRSHILAGDRVPSFLAFSMPNSDKQEPTWGYDNSAPPNGARHDANATRLHDNLVRDRMRANLVGIVPDAAQRRALPIHLCGHSMGGIIARSWIFRDDLAEKPPLRRVVSFDGVHGGTSNNYTVKGFAEYLMNGTNAADNGAPTTPGWNYTRDVGVDRDRLLISSSDDTVRPNCSALGIGRTMRGSDWYGANSYDKANGHRGRFIGGIEWRRTESHGGVKEEEEPIRRAARFIYDATRPSGSSVSSNDLAATCPGANGLGEPPQFGVLHVTLAAPAGSSTQTLIALDANPSIAVNAWLADASASLDLLDGGGVSLVPPDAVVEPIEDGYLLTFEVPSPPQGDVTLVVSASGSAPASAAIEFVFQNGRGVDLTFPEQPTPAGDPVFIQASVRDPNDAVLVGHAGGIQAEITLPDDSVDVVELLDDGAHGDGDPGDGVFGVVYTNTTLGGRYRVEARAQISLSLDAVHRSSPGLFVVDSDPAQIIDVVGERLIDDDGDELAEVIELDVLIAVNEPGPYELRGELLDESGDVAATALISFAGAPLPGGMLATLRFDASDLVAHGVDGLWTLRARLVSGAQRMLVSAAQRAVTAIQSLVDLVTPAAPAVESIVPAIGRIPGGNVIAIQGLRMSWITSVTIDGRPATDLQVLSGTSIRVRVPRAPDCDGESVDVRLVTPWRETTVEDGYEYADACDCPDFDLDGSVGLADLSILLTNFGVVAGASHADGDMNGDGAVSLADLGILLSWFGARCP